MTTKIPLALVEDRQQREHWHIMKGDQTLCGAETNGTEWHLPEENFIRLRLCLPCWFALSESNALLIEPPAHACSDCGKDHRILIKTFPLGSRVVLLRTIKEINLDILPGTFGKIVNHTDDGRPVVEFSSPSKNAHSFHYPESCLAVLHE